MTAKSCKWKIICVIPQTRCYNLGNLLIVTVGPVRLLGLESSCVIVYSH